MRTSILANRRALDRRKSNMDEFKIKRSAMTIFKYLSFNDINAYLGSLFDISLFAKAFESVDRVVAMLVFVAVVMIIFAFIFRRTISVIPAAAARIRLGRIDYIKY